MKKLLSILLSLSLLLTSVVGIELTANAAITGIYSTSNGKTVDAGSTIKIPISIKNNVGLMGLKLMFTYDPDYLAPTSDVIPGSIVTDSFEDNINGDAVPGGFNVYWSDSANTTSNGILFYVEFEVNASVVGTTKIGIDYSDIDTYNEDFEDVPLACENISLNVKNSAYSSFAKLTASADDAFAGQEVTLKINISQILNTDSLYFNVGYDSSVLELSTVSAPSSVQFSYVDSGSLASVTVGVITSALEGEELVNLTFKVKEEAPSGEYSFNIDSTMNSLMCKGCSFKITNNIPSKIYSDRELSFKKDENLTVPVRISNNKGIMGFHLDFEYDEEKITTVSASLGSSFKGNSANSISNESGKFSFIWTGTDEIAKNDILLNIVFKCVSDKVDDSAEIIVTYNQNNTFNGKYEDVEFNCESISIELNPSCKHAYSGVVTNPNCTEKGYTTYTCNLCGDSYVGDYVNATGHKEVIDRGVTPTCQKTGLTQGSHCSVCGVVITPQQTLAKTDHKYTDKVVAPTCTAKGYTNHTCSYCSTSYKDTYVDMLPHTEVVDKAVEPTCQSTGLTQGSHCSVCGKVIIAQQTVEESEHDYYERLVEPTCTKRGYIECICKSCGSSYIEQYYDLLPHEVVFDDRVEPTCTKDGLTEGSHCYVCGTVLDKQETIPKLEHWFIDDEMYCQYGCGTINPYYSSTGEYGSYSYVVENGEITISSCAYDTDGSLKIPSKINGFPVTAIADGAFSNCNGLTSVTIPNGVKTIGSEAFSYCVNLESVTIPSTVTYIDDYAFIDCHSLKEITIPKGVEDIGNCVFDYCYSLEKINVDKNNKYYSSENGVLFNKDKTVLISYPGGNPRTSYVVPDGVYLICEEAFPKFPYALSSITLPSSLEVIGNDAFYGAEGYSIKTVYYNGTSAEFDKINICDYNPELIVAKKYFVTAKLSTSSYTYNKKTKKPTVTVYDPKGYEISSSSYTVSYAKGRKNVGVYKVTIKLNGKYKGTLTPSFTIKPKSTSISSLKAGSKKFTVKWKKQKTQTSGYQIQYSTSSKFKKVKKVTIKKNTTTSKTISKLKSKKKYYVRVRTYKTVKVNGKSTKVYSSWSKAKKVTVK